MLGLLLAGPLGIAIALFLAMIAPPRVRAVIGPLVEMLAAVPSIIFGFWGFLVLAPFIQQPRAIAAQRARVHPAVRRCLRRPA